MNIQEIVKKQTIDIERIIKACNGIYSISITDEICALDFKDYAIGGDAEWSEDGTQFKVSFNDAQNVEVSIDDFIKYQFQYTDDAVEISDACEDQGLINDLRDAQGDAASELIEKYSTETIE